MMVANAVSIGVDKIGAFGISLVGGFVIANSILVSIDKLSATLINCCRLFGLVVTASRSCVVLSCYLADGEDCKSQR
jgi:hypothetical protein